MTLFIYEHLTSGALLNEPFSPGLMHEGDAMLNTLSQDLLALGYDVVLLRDARLPALPLHRRLRVLNVSTSESFLQCWQKSLQASSHIILIAPETDGVLYQLVKDIEQHPIRHLGCSPSAIQTCTDKYQTSQQLSAHGLLTPTTQTVSEWLQSDQDDAVWVIKPRDGAGCENTYKLSTRELNQYLDAQSNEQHARQIVQPFINGETLSLSLFLSDTGSEILSVNRQYINEAGNQLSLSHCQPGYDELISHQHAQALVEEIRATIQGLWGFVGIDLVLSDGQVWIIEINPRLTSSYAEPEFRQHRNPALALHQSLQA